MTERHDSNASRHARHAEAVVADGPDRSGHVRAVGVLVLGVPVVTDEVVAVDVVDLPVSVVVDAGRSAGRRTIRPSRVVQSPQLPEPRVVRRIREMDDTIRLGVARKCWRQIILQGSGLRESGLRPQPPYGIFANPNARWREDDYAPGTARVNLCQPETFRKAWLIGSNMVSEGLAATCRRDAVVIASAALN